MKPVSAVRSHCIFIDLGTAEMFNTDTVLVHSITGKIVMLGILKD